jgi:hypothetical protein
MRLLLKMATKTQKKCNASPPFRPSLSLSVYASPYQSLTGTPIPPPPMHVGALKSGDWS